MAIGKMRQHTAVVEKRNIVNTPGLGIEEVWLPEKNIECTIFTQAHLFHLTVGYDHIMFMDEKPGLTVEHRIIWIDQGVEKKLRYKRDYNPGGQGVYWAVALMTEKQ